LTSLNRLIEEAAGMVGHQLNRSYIALRLDLDPDLPLMDLDQDKIKQVFLNL
jgi:signal transduction histidine kinase